MTTEIKQIIYSNVKVKNKKDHCFLMGEAIKQLLDNISLEQGESKFNFNYISYIDKDHLLIDYVEKTSKLLKIINK